MDFNQAFALSSGAPIAIVVESRSGSHECKVITFSTGYIIVAGIALDAGPEVDPTVAYTGYDPAAAG